jgi:hypothetical protein
MPSLLIDRFLRDNDTGETSGLEYDNKILLLKKKVTFGHGIPLK